VLFDAFDLNNNGSLSGRELAACSCAMYDTNTNNEITWDEFRVGFAKAPLFDLGGPGPDDAPSARPATGAPQPPATPGAAAKPKAGMAATQAAGRAGKATYDVGEQVEVNVAGTWYPATIVGVRDGRYSLSRHDRSFGVTTDNDWVAADRLRPYTAPPRTATPSATALPAAVPTGDYDCVTYGIATSVGKLRIYSGGMSSGVTRDASGPQHRFVYTPGSGTLLWPEGLTIAGWRVEAAEYRPESNGTPSISLHYRRQAGGNLNSMSCTRH
jgi:hypothetical protein